MKKIISVSLCLAVLFPINSYAVLATTPDWAVPKNLHVYNDDGQTYVDHVQGECQQVRYRLDPNHKKYDAIVSILLAAQMANKKVILRYDHNSGCTQGRIVGVYIQ